MREHLYFITENKTISVCCCLWCFLCSIGQKVVLTRKGVKGKLVLQSLSSDECRVSENEEADVTKSLWRAVSDLMMEWTPGFLQVALDTHKVSCLQTNLWRGRMHVLCRDTKVRTIMVPDQQRPVVKSPRKRLIRGIFEVAERGNSEATEEEINLDWINLESLPNCFYDWCFGGESLRFSVPAVPNGVSARRVIKQLSLDF